MGRTVLWLEVCVLVCGCEGRARRKGLGVCRFALQGTRAQYLRVVNSCPVPPYRQLVPSTFISLALLLVLAIAKDRRSGFDVSFIQRVLLWRNPKHTTQPPRTKQSSCTSYRRRVMNRRVIQTFTTRTPAASSLTIFYARHTQGPTGRSR
jgi:hypothetical protein